MRTLRLRVQSNNTMDARATIQHVLLAIRYLDAILSHQQLWTNSPSVQTETSEVVKTMVEW